MRRHLIFGLLLMLLGWTSVQAQIIYVKSGANGTGSSWADATGNLQDALAASTAGTQIWVAQGAYYPTQCNPCSITEKDTPFQIPDGVALYGGFLGNESNLGQRDWQNHPTLLNGDIDRDGTPANNAYTILYMRNVSAATIVDGFEVTNGNADNGNYDVYTRINSGAGLYNDGSLTGGSSNPTIRNCKFTHHYGRGFGAAIMNYGGFGGMSSPMISHCAFNDNQVANSGGAVFNSGVFSGQTATHFTNCTFNNNQANNGGAVYNQSSESGNSTVVFESCEFTANTATVWGGAIVDFGNKGQCLSVYNHCVFSDNSANQGGAIFNDGSFQGLCNPTFSNCQWTDNWAGNGGAGVYSQGPFEGESNPQFWNCQFTGNNTNASGAALYFNGQEGNSNPTLTNCVFVFNKALMYGGGMYNFGKTGHSNPKITNCVFIRNEGQAAGSIYNYGGVNGQSNPVVTNCTFYKNRAVVGPCIYNQAADPTGEVRPVVSNCIFWENISDSGFGLVFQNGHAQPTISHSLIPLNDCSELNTDSNSSVTCGSGILFNIDPKFIDPLVENLHLQSDSPVRDIGDNAAINATGIMVDLDSVNRIDNGVVDFGVYEYHSNIYQAPDIITQSSDINLCEQEMVELFVITSGTPPLSYQWKKAGQIINGATDSLLVFLSASVFDAASYTCTVSSAIGDSVESSPIELSVNPLLTVGLSIEASQVNICAEETVTFLALPVNGGLDPQYSWTLNGQAIGGNQNQLLLSDLNDGDQVACVLTSSENCTISSSANSNNIAIQVEPLVAVSVALDVSPITSCEGELLTFVANPVNGGTSPLYTWYLNGSEIQSGASASLALDSLHNNDQISCELWSSEICAINNPAVSESIEVAINPLLEVSVSLQASTTRICEGEAITFTATTVNGGIDPQYTWLLNGSPVGSNSSQLILDILEDGDEVSCRLTSSENCTQQNSVNSEAVKIEVQTPLEVAISIAASSTDLCTGETVVLSATAVNGGNDPQYRWLINGGEVAGNIAELILTAPADGDVISCELTSSETCVLESIAVSNEVELTVNETLAASISIEASDTSICEGEMVTLTSISEHGGANPIYKWLVNGIDQNVNEAVLSLSTLENGDMVRCELYASSPCVVQSPVLSNAVIFTVKALEEASIKIDVNTTTVCLGDTLFFNALVINGGDQPIYEWLLNGDEVGNATAAYSIADLPLGESTIRCALISSESCLIENPVASNVISVDVVNPDSCWITATNELSDTEKASIYPNPAFDRTFELVLEGYRKTLNVEIRDVQGKLWYKAEGIEAFQKKSINIEFTNSSQGLFFVQLTSAEKIKVIKLLLL